MQLPLAELHHNSQTQPPINLQSVKIIQQQTNENQHSLLASAIQKIKKPNIIKRINFKRLPKQESNKFLQIQKVQKQKQQSQTFLASLTQDDLDPSQTPIQKQYNKRAKQPIKPPKPQIQNKLFKDIVIQDDKEITDQIQYELQYKKQVKIPSKLLQKVSQRVQKLKDRLQFKSLSASKREFIKNLQRLTTIQEMQVVVDVPKVMKGKNSQTDAAIFLKNVKPNSQSLLSQTKQPEAEDKKIDRTKFFTTMQRDIKLKKAESINLNDTQCYKKTTLQHLQCVKKKVFRQREQPKKMKERLDSLRNKAEEQSQQLISNDVPIPYSCLQTDSEQVSKIGQKQIVNINQNSKSIIVNNKQEIQQSNTSNIEINDIKQTSKRIDKKKRKKRSYAERFIEVEAEESNSNKQQDDGQQSEDDNADLQGLIDNDYVEDEEGQRRAYQMFVQDMKNKQDKEFQRIQQRINKRKLVAKQALERRISIEKQQQEKEEEQKQEIRRQIIRNLLIQPDQQNTNSSIEAFKRLQIQFGIIQGNKNTKKFNPSFNDKIQESKPLQRPQRNGLRAGNGITSFQILKKHKQKINNGIPQIDMLHSNQ